MDSFDALARELTDAVFDFFPDLAVGLGRHDYDGRLRIKSAEALADQCDRLRGLVDRLDRLDVGALDGRRRIDAEMMRIEAERFVFDVEELRLPFRQPLFYAPSLSLTHYVQREYAPIERRIEHVGRVLRTVPDYLAAARLNLERELPRSWLETSSLVYRGLAEFFEGPLGTWASAAPEHAERIRPCVDRAVGAVRGFVEWLRAERLPYATEQFALGDGPFERLLWVQERIRATPEQFEAIAREELARNQDRLGEARARVSGSSPWRERVSESELLSEARRISVEALRFVEREQLVTLPTDEAFEVTETPSFLRWNFAFLNPAGPWEPVRRSFYYLTPPDPRWPEPERRAYLPLRGRLLTTTVHEVVPGHFVHAARLAGCQGPVRRAFGSYASTEGWAHYCEEMVLDQGFGDDDPGLRVVQVEEALVRNCRMLASVLLHARGTGVDEVQTLFERVCGADPATARQQARRGTFDPGYFAYALGKRQLLELREELRRRRGSEFELREFHDRFLDQGAPPIAVVRPHLLEEMARPAGVL